MPSLISSKLPLNSVDDNLRPNHFHLNNDDHCFYIGTYTAKQKANHSKMNRFIINFKKPLTRKNQSDWVYKESAINEAARLISSLNAWDRMKNLTWVPIPPSLLKEDPAYDARLFRVLARLKAKGPDNFDFRELILQKSGRSSAHGSKSRPNPQELIKNYRIDETQILPEPKSILVFDDVLVTGASFRAAKSVLQAKFPNIPIYGFFLARNEWV